MDSIFTGILFSSIQEGEKSLERLPQYELPEFIRKNEPNMKYIPLIRVKRADYSGLT